MAPSDIVSLKHLSFSGYHDKQGELLNRVLNALVNFKVSEDRFEIFKESYERSLKNYRRSQPYSHAEYFNDVALSDKLWTREDKLAALEGVKASDVQDFLGRLFKNVHVECLACGNLTPDRALGYAEDVRRILTDSFGSRPISESEKPVDRQVMLPEKSNLCHQVGTGFYG